MAFNLTDKATVKKDLNTKTPQLVLEIDGVDTVYGAVEIKKFLLVGDPDWTIGEPLFVGGQIPEVGSLRPVEGQRSYISFSGGTSTKLTQKLTPDTGKGSSISSMQIALVDKNQEITNLITPGNVVEDILGRKCKVWLGFDDTAFKDDFIVVFRGIIDDIDAGSGRVILNIAHPDKKRGSSTFEKASTELDGNLGAAITTVSVDNTAAFLDSITGPDGSEDSTVKYYIRIEDELIQYTGISGNDFTGCLRGQLGTQASSHSDGANVESFYRLTSDAVDIALKIMLSGWQGPFVEDVEVTSFNFIGAGTDRVEDAIYFNEIDVERDYGLTIGDYVTTTGSAEGANNVSLQQITDVVKTVNGSYVVASGAGFVDEGTSAAVIDFRSKYDTYPSGLKMSPDEVAVKEIERVQSLFLSSFEYDFYLKDTIEDSREFIDEEIYNPSGAFSIPRGGRTSVGVHSPPIPGSRVTTLNTNNVIDPSSVNIRRTIGKNFFNAVIYKFDDQPLDDRFARGVVTLSATSLSRIPVGNKPLIIESLGMKTILNAEAQATSATSRRLKKYRFGAEFITGLKVNFKAGMTVEIGDIVLFDLAALQVSDIQTGDRSGEPRLFEVVNKVLDIKTGAVSLDLTDTSFDKDTRYALISPASDIKSGASQTQFIIQSTGNSVYGANEYRKWEPYLGTTIRVRSADFSISGTAVLSSIVGNTITLASALGFVPTAGMVMQLDNYDTQTDAVKLVYGFMTDDPAFADGGVQYSMI